MGVSQLAMARELGISLQSTELNRLGKACHHDRHGAPACAAAEHRRNSGSACKPIASHRVINRKRAS